MSSFSENSNVQAGQPVPTDGLTPPTLITSPDGALVGNAPASTSEDATSSQSITASMNAQEFFPQEASNTPPVPTPSGDLILEPSSETTSADKPGPSARRQPAH